MASGNGLRLRFPISSISTADLNSADMNTEESESPRRTLRVRSKPKKYHDFLEQSPTKRRVENSPSSESEEEDFAEGLCPQRPTALFSNDDVEGQDMFKFKARHTKLDLQKKVNEVLSNSPKVYDSPATPRKNKAHEATPKHVKNIIKKRIIREVESDSGEDFSGSSSDFVPDESENETESSQSSGSASEAGEGDDETKKSTIKLPKAKSKMKPKDSEYFVTPDNYFMMHSSKKITTSDHTLAKLKQLNLNEHVQDIEMSQEHKDKVHDLNSSYEQMFNKWLFVLSEHFNIVLYGVGSKRSLVHKFLEQKLHDFPCIVVNGFFPSLTVKEVLEGIMIELLGNSHVPSNIGDVVNLIDTQLTENDANLFLLIHNIDGPMLRNEKAQAMLASISQIKNVHTIATIDHINAPLLWDHSKLSKFNFTWWDVTTFLPYSEETSFENSLLTHHSGALQLSSLKSVHQSLTTNAKGILNVIIQYQLDNHKQAHYQGLPFKDLYAKCREQFLVSTDLALRAQLTEFLDHKLVKMKRTYDGSENLVLPIDNALLQQFLEENN